MEELIEKLQMAQRCAQMHHWKTKSFSLHLALGELYDSISSLMDELFEMYMGAYGTEAHIDLSPANEFDEQNPINFVNELHEFLKGAETSMLPQDGFLINKFQELQGEVSRIKYKVENLS